jgi:hypothetical protein
MGIESFEKSGPMAEISHGFMLEEIQRSSIAILVRI